MSEPEERMYGLWDSPLSAKAMAGDLSLKDVQWTDSGELIWLEGRDGRGVLVCGEPGGAARDLTQEVDVSGGVGYGGGEFTVHGETVFFAASDGKLYRIGIASGAPAALTPDFGRVASPAVSPDGQWVVYVYTDGTDDVLAAVDAEGDKWPTKLVSGDDFYMHPTWSPDGSHIAWISWDHPAMPWSETRLHLGGVDRAADTLQVVEQDVVAGAHDVSVLQPGFSPDGEKLAYLSDEDGWWHLYVRDLGTGEVTQLTAGEFEVGGPAWIQGLRYYDWKPDSSGLIAVRNDSGRMDLLDVSLDSGQAQAEMLDGYTSFGQLDVAPDGTLTALASSSTTPTRVVVSNLEGGDRTVRHSSAERVPSDELATLEPVSWQAESEGETVEIHGNYYAPTNSSFTSSGKPPAMVMIHGGPTGQRTARWEPGHQFFATRGFAVLDVDYRGSTGYGREYRDALYGKWGVYDVEDADSGARYLAEQGLADPDRIVIMGGSAGGYTVFQTLVNEPGVFAAGISKYGISNTITLTLDTHKFEQHYNESLLGSLPEDVDILRERSPLFHADQIEDAVAVFQGGEDKVVPQNQADELVAQLEKQGTPHIYKVYEEEGHGWRRSETIEDFYGRVMDFLEQHVLYT